MNESSNGKYKYAGWHSQNGCVPQAQDGAPSVSNVESIVCHTSNPHDEASCRSATRPFWTGHPAELRGRLHGWRANHVDRLTLTDVLCRRHTDNLKEFVWAPLRV